MGQSDFERLGGFAGLRPLIIRFIDRVYEDAIIGFFFANVDRTQLVARECEFAAAHLGGPKQYGGKPIRQAHRPHGINRGQFRRRLWLLEQTLRDASVPDAIISRWLAHDRRLESAITDGSDCGDDAEP